MTLNEWKISVDQLYEWRNLLSEPNPDTTAVVEQIMDILEQMGVRDLEKRYFIISNEKGNEAGEFGWIVRYNPITGFIRDGMITVIEEFSIGELPLDEHIIVPIADLTEITKEEYNKLGNIISDGEDPCYLVADILDEKKGIKKPRSSSSFELAQQEMEASLAQLKDRYNLSNNQWIELFSMMIQNLAKGTIHS